MLTQYESAATSELVDEEVEEQAVTHSSPENSGDDAGEVDDWCPYIDPDYDGPYSTLDAFPEIAENISTQTERPDAIIKKFREALDTNRLNLYACRLSTDNIRTIVLPFLAQNPQITELRIDGNHIRDEGATLIASNRTIRKLDASTNDITDVGVMALCQNRNITSLQIGFNSLTERGIEALANNAILTELYISFEQLHHNINTRALDFFLRNDTLQIFHCAGVWAETLDDFWRELRQQRALRAASASVEATSSISCSSVALTRIASASLSASGPLAIASAAPLEPTVREMVSHGVTTQHSVDDSSLPATIPTSSAASTLLTSPAATSTALDTGCVLSERVRNTIQPAQHASSSSPAPFLHSYHRFVESSRRPTHAINPPMPPWIPAGTGRSYNIYARPQSKKYRKAPLQLL